MFINAIYRGTSVRLGRLESSGAASVVLNDFVVALESCFESLPANQRRKLVEKAQQSQIDLLQRQMVSGEEDARIVIADDVQGWTTIEIILGAQDALVMLQDLITRFSGDTPDFAPEMALECADVAAKVTGYHDWLQQVTHAYETFGKTLESASREASRRALGGGSPGEAPKPKMGPEDVAARVKAARRTVAQDGSPKH